MVHSVLPESVPNAEWRPRRLFRSLQFDGIDDYGVISYSPELDNPEMSVVVLFEYDVLPTDYFSNKFLDKSNWPEKSGWWVDVLPATSGAPGAIRFWSGGGDTTSSFDATTNYISKPKEKIMFAGVTDGRTFMKTYVNGSYDSQIVLSKPRASNTLDLKIGTYSTGYFDGKIYLILVYSRALSDSEIKHIYQNPYNPPLDGLVLWLSPASIDPVAGKWWDLSGNGNHGTIYGATVVEEEGEVTVQ